MSKGIYRVGFPVSEASEETLNRMGVAYTIVEPRAQLVTSARSVIGKPYKRGASVLRDAPNGFDCSALTAWAAVESGIAIPRVTIDQFVFSKRINKEDLEPGDLVFVNTGEIIHTKGSFFSQVLGIKVEENPIRTETLEYMPGTKVPGGVDHVGVYIGNGKIIHSSCKRGGVIEEDLDASPSFQNIVGYGRIVDNEEKRFVVEVPADRPDLRTAESFKNELKKYV